MTHIPLDDPIIERAKALIPTTYWGQTWIAGSAATRYPQNKDVDLWICGCTPAVPLDKVIPTGRKFPVPDGTITELTAEDMEYDHMAWKAIDEDGLQIMTSERTIAALLADFDISCHAAAVHMLTGEVVRAPKYSETVKVIGYQVAVTTLTRYLRFAERYKDWWGLHDEETQRCAARAFSLYTQEQMREGEWKYLVLDRGL